MSNLPQDFLNLLHSVTAKRPKTVIEHIIKYGQITTEELTNLYGYNHPPRAIRDVREQGIPIETFRVKDSQGKTISAYKFGDPNNVRSTQLSGRTAFSSSLKRSLLDQYGSKCNITLSFHPERELQIDHRIPFEIAGDTKNSQDPQDYMLLSASANRNKSWSCENCPNWQLKQVEICLTCYWAYPENYQHIATRQIRRVDLEWEGNEIDDYNDIKQSSENADIPISTYIKNLIQKNKD